jgi:hypothetical protein
MFSAIHAIPKIFCNPSCSHEKADTRVILHADDCAGSVLHNVPIMTTRKDVLVLANGLHKILIMTTDADVLVLAIGHYQKMTATELRIVFRCGKNFRYIAAHDIANYFRPGKARALLVFHAFPAYVTRCPFSLEGKGKQRFLAFTFI